MLEVSSQNLARHARWSEPVQRQLLHRAPALLADNRHLTDEVAAALAAAADPDTLARLLRARPEVSPRVWAAVTTRLTQLLADPEADPVAHAALDDAVRAALLACPTETEARARAALVPDAPLPHTAVVLLALGVRPPAQVPHAYLIPTLHWLASPAAAGHTDADVGAWLLARDADADHRSDLAVEAAAALLLVRPGLYAYADRVPVLGNAEGALALARRHADRAGTGGWWSRATGRTKALASLLRIVAHARHSALPRELRAAGWVVAQLCLVQGWSPRQRRVLAEQLAAVGANHLGWALPRVAAAVGADRPVPGFAQVTWARLRPHPREPLPAAAVARLRATHQAGDLARALADADPAREATGWVVALRLADTFTGTIEELAAVAGTVAAPAR